ncbi:MAG: dienelactone hydrolase family protein [Bacteroidales bacterium]|nr:dienelactone hydrolase family protein [Bacteroidales bacterium]
MKRIDFLKTMGVAGIGMGIPGLAHGMTETETPDLPPLLVDSKGKPIHSRSKWKKEREQIKKRWLDYLGVMNPNPKTPELKILKEERLDGLVRQYVEYEGEPGILVRGYLLIPENMNKPLPGVVALHSTSDNQMIHIAGIEEGRLVAFGYKLAKQGFVVFCPQCFLWHDKGDRTYEQQVDLFTEHHPGSKGMARMLFDAQRAVDVLESLKEVDSSRIGTMGHSLGAKEAFYLGAFDDRVKAIVSNEGGIGIEMSNWDDIWYLSKDIHEFGHEHHEVLALAAPKPFLLIGGDGYDGELSRPYIEAVKPVYSLYNKEQNLALKNHGEGHSAVPLAEKWTYNWMKDHLK